MKKLLSGLFFALMLVAPSFAYAQVVDTTPATVSDLDALKIELIQVLMQEVKLLQAQLTSLQDQQTTTAADVATIKASTSTGGGVDNTITVAPFTVYTTAYEQGQNDVYYAGNEKIDPSSVSLESDSGQRLPITFTTASSRTWGVNDVSWNHDEAGNPINTVYGGEMFRLTPSSNIPNGNYFITVSSVNGDTYTTKHVITVSN